MTSIGIVFLLRIIIRMDVKKYQNLIGLKRYSNIQNFVSGFPHMRVDFYIEGDRVIFGECTLLSFSGNQPFEPIDFDYELEALIFRNLNRIC